VEAGYDLRLSHDHPTAAPYRPELEERLALARDDLRSAVCEAGAKAGDLTDDASLLEAVNGGIRRSGRYVFLFDDRDGDSFALARIQTEDEPREVLLFDDPFAYRLTVLDETLLVDYPTYRDSRLGRPVSRPTATYARNGTVRVDQSVAVSVGEHRFLPHAASLQAAAKLGEQDEAFLSLMDAPLVDLLTLTKSVLRWRSLEQLWSMIQSRPRSEQLRRFGEDYAARAELRAAAELREALRVVPDPDRELGDPLQQRIFELGSLSAMIHGEPLGQVADLLALAALSMRTGNRAPSFEAARILVVELTANLRQGEPSPEVDARAFARLARATPAELRALARGLYAAKTR
jgi:hypothetical protein